MSFSVFHVTCSNKIFTLAIAPVLFVSVNRLCEFAMLTDVYMLLSPQEEEVPEETHVQAHWATKFNLSVLYPKFFGDTGTYMLLWTWVEQKSTH